MPQQTTLHPAFDPSPTIEVEDERLGRLRRFNLGMGVLHLVSGIAMLLLGNDFSLGVSTFNLNGPPGTPLEDGTLTELFAVQLAPATAAFLLLSAAFHFLIASPLGFSKYADELRHGRNRFRWVEYALSSTLMILLIALVTNITDIAALIALAGVNVSMILFGWLMEMSNRLDGDADRDHPTSRVWWSPFWFGSVAGITPWLAIAIALASGLSVEGAAEPPTFVYGIIASLFVFFNSFALNQWLQYRQVGKWADYVFGETVYIVLSLVSKSALAWQIFANVLVS